MQVNYRPGRLAGGFILWLGCLCAALVGRATEAAAYDKIVVFGDSYSDVGNIRIATNGMSPAAPYFQGRYSDGPVWAETLAASLGSKLLPSLTPDGSGTDYAYGGAAATMDQPPIPSLLSQTKQYLNAVSGHADPNALYVIWGGSNDLLLDWDDNPSAIPALPAAYAQAVLTMMTELKQAGAKSFLVGQVPDMGKTPAWNWSASQAQAASADAAAMNAKEQAVVSAAVTNGPLGGVSIYNLTAFQMMDQVIVPNIAAEMSGGLPYFTLTNVTGYCLKGGTPCANPEDYFFWDGIHPTATAHALFAQRALAVVAP